MTYSHMDKPQDLEEDLRDRAVLWMARSDFLLSTSQKWPNFLFGSLRSPPTLDYFDYSALQPMFPAITLGFVQSCSMQS